MAFDLLITLVLVLLNGFFVAAEFAIVKVRYSQIQVRAQSGNKSAKIAQQIIDKLDAYLSATQLGITLASLALGWTGEPVVSKLIIRIMHVFGVDLPEETAHAVALPIAFFVITTLHIVFGELAPKSLAIRKPEATTLVIAMPLKLFYDLFRPFIWMMNGLSNLFLKLVGIQPAGEHDIHTTEELQLLVRQSKEGGNIEAENYAIIKNAFNFTDHTAKQIMVPRQQIFALDSELPIAEMVRRMLDTGYSRVPIYKDSLDNLIGVVHVKECAKKFIENPNFSIKEVLHPVLYIIETKHISDILKEFQKSHIHLAVIIDEYGGTEGVLSLEDIIEQLVGEIQDEDDDEKSIVEKKGDLYIVQSTQPLLDINDYLPRPFLINESYSSLSGLILYHFNGIPELGESIEVEGYAIKVSRVTNRTIQLVELTDLQGNTSNPEKEHESGR